MAMRMRLDVTGHFCNRGQYKGLIDRKRNDRGEACSRLGLKVRHHGFQVLHYSQDNWHYRPLYATDDAMAAMLVAEHDEAVDGQVGWIQHQTIHPPKRPERAGKEENSS